MDQSDQSQQSGPFDESPGQVSATRVIVIPACLLVVVTACVVILYCTFAGKPVPDIPIGTSAFMLSILGTLLGAKVFQRNIENKSP